MIYEISDMETRKTYKVDGRNIRQFLNDWGCQGTSKWHAQINFVADFYEGKHHYRFQTIDAEDYLGIMIIATGELS